jgi:sugar/nucleoside kinase (ribokinase family)
MAEVACLGILVADIVGHPIASLPAAGELALLDCYESHVGGCAANAAADLWRLGRSASVLGKVGRDFLGEFVLQDLNRLGIDTSFVRRSQTHPTSCTFIVNVQGEDRRCFHCFGANADFSIADFDAKVFDGARALYVGGYLALPAFGAEHLVELFRTAKLRRLITALDVVIPAGAPSRFEDIQQVLLYTDVFLPGEDEARALTGRSDPLEQSELLARFNPAGTIVITQGARGALARRGSEVLRAGAFQVDSIDESGSGEAFDAGFLAGMLEGWPLEDTLRFASAVGASCTRAWGCHEGVFKFDEARSFVAQNQLEIERIG